MNEVIEILTKVGAIISGSHFIGTSGLHFNTYINKDVLYPHTKETSLICKLFAEKNKHLNVEVVAAPALGGIILAQGTAYALSEIFKKEVLAVFTEKTFDINQVFARGYDQYVKDKNVLVLEDLTTTGGSVKKVIESVKKAGGNVVGVSVMVNKNPKGVNADTLGVSFNSLGEMEVEIYKEKDCPLCKAKVPINTTVGHGKKYLESKNDHR